MPPTLETDLEALFSSRADVAFALLFGSAASGRRTAESDVDLADDFVRVKQRSRSLSEIDRSRLVRIVDFLDDELADAPDFERPDLERYSTDRTFRGTGALGAGPGDGFGPGFGAGMPGWFMGRGMMRDIRDTSRWLEDRGR
ncbi:MAG: nucleotidyltransferase domain-containing protein [Spirochaetota bacterium]